MALIDTAGGNAGSYTYDPYGKTSVTSGSSTTAAQTNPWRYTGAYQNLTDGYYHLGARYYDAAGHFTQPDSSDQENNSYLYASADPVNASDPTGLLTWWQRGLVWAAVHGILAVIPALICAQPGLLPLCIGFSVLYSALAGGITYGVIATMEHRSNARIRSAFLRGFVTGASFGLLKRLRVLAIARAIARYLFKYIRMWT